jgi:hypothetical protein
VKKEYEEMTRKELIEIARIRGIKNISKMNKEKIINSIKSSKKPLKKIKEIEEMLKVEVPKNYNETHIEFIPKEPGNVFVSWEVSESDTKRVEGILEIIEDKKEFLSIPVKLPSGKGYIKVEEGKEFRALIGVNEKGKFKEIISSKQILVPASKPSKDKNIEFGVIGATKKRVKKNFSVDKEMERSKNKIAAEAKKIKYLKYPKEGK